MFCQVASYYSLGYEQVLKLPIRVFWLYSNTVQRIEAQRATRSVRVALHSSSGEAANALLTELHEETGKVIAFSGARVPDFKRDEGIRETLSQF